MITGLVSAGLLLILLTTTTPAKTGAFGILSVFLLGYVITLTVVTYIVWSVAFLLEKILKQRSHVVPSGTHSMSFKRAYYFSSVLALGPIIIVGLQSVGGVGVYDVGLVALFMSLGCIYVARRTT